MRQWPVAGTTRKLRHGLLLCSAAAGQIQQRPAPAQGALFKLEWFANRYRTLPQFVRVAAFWDTAIKANEENDETACVVLGVSADGNPYILAAAHGHWETPEVVAKLIEQSARLLKIYRHNYAGDYVEDKVSGTTLMQYVRRSQPDLSLIPIRADADKTIRAHGVTPICETGRVLFPDPAIFPAARQWTDDLVNNLISFPAAKNDDLTDAFVYAVKWFLTSSRQRVSHRGRSGMV